MSDPKGQWKSWKDYTNNQVDGGGSADGTDPSLFKYSDSTEQNIHKPQSFPNNRFQENPEKM